MARHPRSDTDFTVVIAGLDPAIHPSSQDFLAKKMDARVKPAHDRPDVRLRRNDVTEKRIHPMLQWFAQFLTAPIVNGFLNAYKAKLAAANAQGAQAVEVARAALLAEIEARKSANAVILAEQGRWYTAIIRPLLAAPVVIYLWKVIVWDIVLALGTTDPIGGDVAEWAGWIVTAYVGGRSLEKIARTIWRRP